MTDRRNQLLTNATTNQLIEMWELTKTNPTPESRTVRMWVSDELMNRNETAYIEWANSDGYQSPRAFFNA